MATFERFEAPYHARKFGPAIDGSDILRFSCDDLAHALFATGRAPGDQARYGYASVWEWLHRVSLIPAYIRWTPRRSLVRSGLALELDRSEKVAVSYALGQAMTGIFSAHVLRVPFLMHVERYASHYKIVFGATRKRADLFGRGASGWVVAEAKGRSRAMEHDLRKKLIAQKRSVRTIGGHRPGMAFGCVASFPPGGGDCLRVDAFDPADDEVETIDLPADVDRFILAYYEPFMAGVAFGEPENDDMFLASSYGRLALRVGLLRPIASLIIEAREGRTQGLYDRITGVLAETPSAQGRRQFLDGTVVETNWDESVTLPDWQAHDEYRPWNRFEQ